MFGKDRAASAFSARCLLRAASQATLATQVDGQPFASLITPAVTGAGDVLMLLSGLAAHTKHVQRHPRCAVFVVGEAENLNPQTAPRLTITGEAVRQDDPALRRHWLARHPYAALYADFTDFCIWQVSPTAGLFVGGFARAEQLDAGDLRVAPETVRALADAEPGIVAHCNADRAQALDTLAHAQGATGHWRMLGVDADGFDMVQDEAVRRMAFDAPVEDGAGVRHALALMLTAARPQW